MASCGASSSFLSTSVRPFGRGKTVLDPTSLPYLHQHEKLDAFSLPCSYVGVTSVTMKDWRQRGKVCHVVPCLSEAARATDTCKCQLLVS